MRRLHRRGLQTSAVNEQLIQIHGKQTITYGFGLQRRQNNITSDSNARGTFNFTGLETGYDFSDYLLSMDRGNLVFLPTPK